MYALALDTASTQMAIALADFDASGKRVELVASREIDAPRQANQVLLSNIDAMLKEAMLDIGDMEAIVVGRGPGSFTGVRIGVATAKGLACGLDVPLYGASTLDAVAWRAWRAGIRGKLGVVADAMRKEVYPVRYELGDAGVVRLERDTVAKPADIVQLWAQEDDCLTITGDGLGKYVGLFEEGSFSIAPQSIWMIDGAGLVDAFGNALVTGTAGTGDATALLPVYTRLSDAEENEQARISNMNSPEEAEKRARLERELHRTDREMRILAPKSGSGTDASQHAEGRNAPRPLILAIESSCDETAAAVLDGDREVLADCIASQIDFHARFGGVVPEIASRKHTEAIVPTVRYTMEQAGLEFADLSAVCCTLGPGLVGALVVGVAFAKGLCFATGLPFIGVNHLEGHLYANRYVDSTLEPPFVALLVSGGHTMLVHVVGWGDYKILGSTLDDAVGEAFDKVAKALGLGYPGGPVLSAYAKDGDARAIRFPRAMMHSGDLQFSLSGLKTAVITYIHEQQSAGMSIDISDLAASFTAAVVDVLVAKSLTACEQTGARVLCIGGGVAANPSLREALFDELGKRGIKVIMPDLGDCSDNASMIAAVGLDLYEAGEFGSFSDDPIAHMPLRHS
jgi:tRNA threonylcarbamoyl adenosine modification protein TsaD/tRNA threonylcarbamoyl adenosine modification protein YeaZ